MFIQTSPFRPVLLQLFPGPVPLSVALCLSLALGNGSGMTLDWAPSCFSNVTLVTLCMVQMLSGVSLFPTPSPNGMGPFQRVSVCAFYYCPLYLLINIFKLIIIIKHINVA